MRFVQAKSFYKGGNVPTLIVIHDMEYPERSNGAEWCAQFFASGQVKASAHYCLAPETRVLCADLVWRPIGDVVEGCHLVATEEHTPGIGGRTLQQAVITKAKRRDVECLRVTFNDGREVVCSLDHRWLVKPPLGGAPWEWRAAEALAEGYRLLAPMRPWEARFDRDAGYLEGIYDGEGCWSSNGDLSFAQKRGAVLDHAHGILTAAGIPYRLADQRDNGVVVTDLSGLQATMQALGQFRPRRLMHEPRWIGRALKSRTHSNYVTITHIERVGVREVVSIETSTHTFFAEGIVSHNCVDNDSIVQCVKDEDGAWHTPGSLPSKGGREINRSSIGIEHTGYAKQTSSEWLDPYSMSMLQLSAELVALLCIKHNIPPVRVSAEDLKAGAKGICGHGDCTKATGVGSHWDPGPNFPWAWYMERVRAHYALLLNGPPTPVEGTPILPDPTWSIIEVGGVRWAVAPDYIAPVGIGQAETIARDRGWELPSKDLVDAIWKAADLKLEPITRSVKNGLLANWGPAMSSKETIDDQKRRIQAAIGGRPYKLLAGSYKDVIRTESGELALYGWHRTDGEPIQKVYTGHARGWIDYSHGLRPAYRL